MPYATVADIQIAAGGPDRLIELADHNGDGTVDRPVIDMALAEAQARIDSYLRRLFDVPFPDGLVPEFVRHLAAGETVYVLKTYRGTVTEDDRLKRQARDEDLQQLQAGRVNPLSPDPYPTRTGGGTPCAEERDAADFGRKGTRGFW